MPAEAFATRPSHGVLHVIHGHGGGTEHHARALIDASRDRYRHHLAIAVGNRWQIEAHQDDGSVRTFEFARGEGESWPAFVGGMCATFRIDVIHLHNITGSRDGLVEALAALDVPYGYTTHDFTFACPTILFLGVDGMYCGAQTDPSFCTRCLAAQPPFAHVDIVDWRAIHRGASRAGGVPPRALAMGRRDAGEVLSRTIRSMSSRMAPPGAWAMRSEGTEDDDARTVDPGQDCTRASRRRRRDRSRCWARSARTRARAGSSVSRISCGRRARAFVSC